MLLQKETFSQTILLVPVKQITMSIHINICWQELSHEFGFNWPHSCEGVNVWNSRQQQRPVYTMSSPCKLQLRWARKQRSFWRGNAYLWYMNWSKSQSLSLFAYSLAPCGGNTETSSSSAASSLSSSDGWLICGLRSNQQYFRYVKQLRDF